MSDDNPMSMVYHQGWKAGYAAANEDFAANGAMFRCTPGKVQVDVDNFKALRDWRRGALERGYGAIDRLIACIENIPIDTRPDYEALAGFFWDYLDATVNDDGPIAPPLHAIEEAREVLERTGVTRWLS